MAPSAPIAVVTGASGYLAVEITKQLLEKGYAVRATVRSLENTEKSDPLVKLAEALPGALGFCAFRVGGREIRKGNHAARMAPQSRPTFARRHARAVRGQPG